MNIGIQNWFSQNSDFDREKKKHLDIYLICELEERDSPVSARECTYKYQSVKYL